MRLQRCAHEDPRRHSPEPLSAFSSSGNIRWRASTPRGVDLCIGVRQHVSVGSNSNVGERGMMLEEGRAAIWEVQVDSGAHCVFASGLRNPVGMAWDASGQVLWTVVNERDELGSDLVPDYLSSVQDSGFYGWPYSYFGQNLDTRVEQSQPALVATALVPDYALGPHTASLGLARSEGGKLPAAFAEGVFIGQHGSWNRRPHSGYKVIFVPFTNGNPVGAPLDVLSGFLSEAGEAMGRPVGVAIASAAGGGRAGLVHASVAMNGPGRAVRHLRRAWAAIPLAVLILLLPGLQPVAIAAEITPPPATLPLRGADFGAGMVVSAQARQLADWVATSGDHAGVPFLIVDKKRASLLVFDANARLRAFSAVLLGSALGDDSVPDIGTRPMAQILPAERTTPAGRFVAERGRNTEGEDVVWVDYDAAVSMHRVRTGNPLERRAERLATSTIEDNRISYGCINVPVAFYESFIQPIFALSKAMVYVLPDIKPVAEVFGAESVGFGANSSVPAHRQGTVGILGDRSASRRQ